MFAQKPTNSKPPNGPYNKPAQNSQDVQAKTTAQDKTTDQVDYVNSYQPPVQKTESKQEKKQEEKQPTQMPSKGKPQMPKTIQEPKIKVDKQNKSASKSNQGKPNKNEFTKADNGHDDKKNNKKNNKKNSEKLEEQNIFTLLGVEGGDQEEKEQFLDELQQVIWEDFLENDLPLLVTTAEKKDIDQILDDKDLNDLDKQDKIIQYLDKLIPDLEEIMLEKALELKEELVLERVAAMKKFYAGDQTKQNKISQAQELYNQNKWASGTKLLNQISSK
ncbi:MAG: hypothetical protein U9O78_00960 [Patescibacteria group bacterium]|nr:hypothetical protein [Patescibacteria group bacterium]